MSTAITTTPAIKPPLKKSEAIEALLLLAKERFDAKEAENKIIREKLQADWDKEVQKSLGKPRSTDFGRPNSWDDFDVRINIKASHKLKTIGQAWDKVKPRRWDVNEEKRFIIQGLNTVTSRASDLLKCPIARISLEALGDAIGIG